MTEQEIVDYLKENRTRGVAFAFMPDEVKDWCEAHKDETIFHVFLDEWRTLKSSIFCEPQGVYCLPKKYNPQSEIKPHWQTFSIDDEGRFFFEGRPYVWCQWANFIADNFDYYSAFGGWLFDNTWRLNPMVTDDEDNIREMYDPSRTVLPGIPTGIRFWRRSTDI